MGFEVFFWRIWYVFEPVLRRAYAGAAAVGDEAVIVSLEGYIRRGFQGVARAGLHTWVNPPIQVERGALGEAQSA